MNDRFLGMFLEEARELLQALESGLMDLEARKDDRAHIDRTFRAAHTLKGAAGMVGLRPVADFTHKVEAILDGFRAGRLEVSAGAISALLRARDHLEVAIADAAEGRSPEPPGALVAALEGLAEGRPVEPETPAAPAPAPREPDPEPPPAPADAAAGGVRVRLTFGPDSFRRGINPPGFLDELRELGPARVELLRDRIPPLEQLDPETCHLAWSVELEGPVGRARLDEALLFLDDPEAEVAIEPIGAAPAPGAPAPATADGPQAPTPPATAAAEGPAAVPGRTARGGRVRVDAEQLDALVGMAGELAVLTDSLGGLAALPGAERWVDRIESLERLGRRLRDTTLELRMVPIEELFVRFPRVVRDLAERSGKRIELRQEGADTQLDRAIIERLFEPMIHLIRNAVDHGLEPPEGREAAGKAPVGRITIAAGHEGDRVAIRIEDDGRGLDRAKILRKGVARGLLAPETPIDDPRVANLIFDAGFSTRDRAGELSGRGVGLDVVRDAIRSLRGTVTLRSAEGRGTTFLIHLPLTLALIDGLLVEAGGDRFVVPIGQVEECVAPAPAELGTTMGRPAASIRGELVPIHRLADDRAAARPAGPRRELLLTRFAEQRVAVEVDRLLGRVQAVIQPLDEGLAGLRAYSGATILGDGSVSLILDLAGVVASLRGGPRSRLGPGDTPVPAPAPDAPTPEPPHGPAP